MFEWLLNVNHRKLSANYRKKLFLEIHGKFTEIHVQKRKLLTQFTAVAWGLRLAAAGLTTRIVRSDTVGRHRARVAH